MISKEQFETVILHAIDRIERDWDNTLCDAITTAHILNEIGFDFCEYSINKCQYVDWIRPFKPVSNHFLHVWWPLDESGKAKRIEVLKTILSNGYEKAVK